MKALVEWVVRDTPPPPSRYPRFDRGDLVPPTHVATGTPRIPGQPLPDGVLVPFYDCDFGPAFAAPTSRASSRCSRRSFARRCRRSCPEWTPTATSSPAFAQCCWRCRSEPTPGWNPLAGGFFKGHIQSLGGGYIAFATTRAERLASGDPRLFARGALRHPRRLRHARPGRGRAAGGGRFPAVGRCRAANRSRRQTVGCYGSYQLSADSYQQLAVSNQLSAIS